MPLSPGLPVAPCENTNREKIKKKCLRTKIIWWLILHFTCIHTHYTVYTHTYKISFSIFFSNWEDLQRWFCQFFCSFLVPKVNPHTYIQLNRTIVHRLLPNCIRGMKLFGCFNGPTFLVIQSRAERKSSVDLQMTIFSPNSWKPWTSGSHSLIPLSPSPLRALCRETPLIVLQNHSCISPSPRFPIYLCSSLASRLPLAPQGTSLYQILLLDYSSRAKKKCNLACVSKAGGTLWKHPQPSAFIHTLINV